MPDNVNYDPLYRTETIISKGIPASNPRMSDAVELKNLKNEVFHHLKGEPDLEGEFYKHLGSKLEQKGLSDVRKVNEMYSKAYDLSRGSKSIRQTSLRKVASGRASDLQIKDMSSAEKPFGTDYVSRSKNLSENYTSKSSGLESKSNFLKNQIDKRKTQLDKLSSEIYIRNKRKWIAAGTVVGGGGLFSGLKGLANTFKKNTN